MHKPEQRDFLKTLQPVGEIVSIQDVVSAVLYLTEASFVTGEILHVDGGAHAGRW
jgi:enoyl-[acyl-carrier-protein] reductase (NADH)